MATDVRARTDYDDPEHYRDGQPCRCQLCSDDMYDAFRDSLEFAELAALDPERQPGHQYATEREAANWRDAWASYAETADSI